MKRLYTTCFFAVMIICLSRNGSSSKLPLETFREETSVSRQAPNTCGILQQVCTPQQCCAQLNIGCIDLIGEGAACGLCAGKGECKEGLACKPTPVPFYKTCQSQGPGGWTHNQNAAAGGPLLAGIMPLGHNQGASANSAAGSSLQPGILPTGNHQNTSSNATAGSPLTVGILPTGHNQNASANANAGAKAGGNSAINPNQSAPAKAGIFASSSNQGAPANASAGSIASSSNQGAPAKASAGSLASNSNQGAPASVAGSSPGATLASNGSNQAVAANVSNVKPPTGGSPSGQQGVHGNLEKLSVSRLAEGVQR